MTNPQPSSVEAQLAVISTKLDLLIAQRDDQEIRLRAQETHEHADVRDHESRLRSLERFKWLVVGAAVLSGGSAVATLVQLAGGGG